MFGRVRYVFASYNEITARGEAGRALLAGSLHRGGLLPNGSPVLFEERVSNSVRTGRCLNDSRRCSPARRDQASNDR